MKIPGFPKPVSKRSATIFGVGAVAVIGYAIYARHKAKAAGLTTLPTTPSTTGDKGAAQGDRIASHTPGGHGSQVTTIKPPHTNAEWVTDAATFLHDQYRENVAEAETALQKYVAGEAVVQGSKDDTIIHMAIAGIGQPPQSGAGGYPPSIRHTT